LELLDILPVNERVRQERSSNKTSPHSGAGNRLHLEFIRKVSERICNHLVEMSPGVIDGRRVFTNDEWGDYLIYKLYPKQRVFVDGRSDFYGEEFSLRYLDVLNGRWDWSEILAKHDVDAILLPTDAGLASTLKETQSWKPVYDDTRTILFYRTGMGPHQPPGEQFSLGSASDGRLERDLRYARMAKQPKP